MPTLLHLDSSPLEGSISREVSGEYTAAWRSAHPDGRVIYRNLAQEPPPPVDAAWIGASFTPEADRTPGQKAKLAISEALVEELEAADSYVIGVPMHNFSIPSVLKLWIDQIVRSGRTFSYSKDGPRGGLRGKRVTLIVASGGDYAPGTPMAGLNFVEPYLRSVFTFLGVTEVEVVTVGGVARLQAGTIDRPTLLEPALSHIRAAVGGSRGHAAEGEVA